MKHLISSITGAIAILAAAAASPALAQDAAPAPDPASCTVHIWPAERMGSLGEGVVWNHVEGEALRGLKERGLLTPERQIALLRSSKSLQFWGVPEQQIVIHDAPPPRRPLGEAPARRSASDAACVREIVIQKIFFLYSGFGDKNLRALVALEDYAEGKAPVRRYTAWGDSSLPNFPPKKPEQNDQAVEQLEHSFNSAWSSFTARAIQELQKPAIARK